MPHLVQFHIPHVGRSSAFHEGKVAPSPQSLCVFQAPGWREVGVVLEVSSTKMTEPPPGMVLLVRTVSEDDRRAEAAAADASSDAMDSFAKLLRRENLGVRPLRAHFDLDRSRLIVWALAPQGSDEIRALDAELRRSTHATSVEFRFVGTRDAAAVLGGCGCCGRPLCCATWLRHPAQQAATMRGVTSTFATGGLCGQVRCCAAFGD